MVSDLGRHGKESYRGRVSREMEVFLGGRLGMENVMEQIATVENIINRLNQNRRRCVRDAREGQGKFTLKQQHRRDNKHHRHNGLHLCSTQKSDLRLHGAGEGAEMDATEEEKLQGVKRKAQIYGDGHPREEPLHDIL